MTATEKLRRLLDERGTEYYPKRADETVWTASNNAHVWACDDLIDGYLEVHMRPITPEQAVEATLGRGTCRNTAPSYLDFLCSECGFVHYHSDANDSGDGNEWRYCPNCGRKVVDI